MDLTSYTKSKKYTDQRVSELTGLDFTDVNNKMEDFETQLNNTARIPIGQVFTAVANQTVFYLSNSYEVGTNSVAVEIDGVPQKVGEGYTETSVTSITLTEPLPAGAIVKVTVFQIPTGIETKIGDVFNSVTDLSTSISDVSNSVSDLSKAANEYEWTTTLGQVTYTFPDGQSYNPDAKWLDVKVGGAPVPLSQIQMDSPTQFTLLVDSSVIPADVKVVARWAETFVPATAGHHTKHELGGQDELDITKLKNYQSQVADQFTSVNSSLAEKMNKVKGWYYFDLDFGGKANDATFDNTPKLLDALNTLNANGGGRLLLGGAKYTFLTPLTVTPQLKGITLEGSNFSVDTNGTSFDYKGTGMFLTFSGGLHTTFLKNISILCNYNTYGIKIETTCTRSGMIDCAIYNTLGGILLNAAAYGIFENVAVYPRGLNSLGTHSEYGLKIGENPAAILEHTYFNRCTFDGGTAFESYCDLVVILGEAGGFHFFECDFCNTINDAGATNGRAFNITSENSKITDIYVTNCNFSRCAGGVYLNAKNYSLQNIVFNNIRFSFRESINTEQGFYVTRGGSNTANLIVKGLDVVTNGGSVKPQYILYGEDNALDSQSSFELSRCEYTTVGQGVLRAGTNVSRVKVEDCRIRKSMRVSYTGDGTTTLYQITLSNQSPYVHLPFVAVGCNLAQVYKYAVANTNGGVLRLDVTFASAPPNGQTFFIYYNIIGGTLEGSGIF